MADSYEIPKKHAYILITSCGIIISLSFIFGFFTGQSFDKNASDRGERPYPQDNISYIAEERITLNTRHENQQKDLQPTSIPEMNVTSGIDPVANFSESSVLTDSIEKTEGLYAIQVSSVPNSNDAERLNKKLRKMNFPSYLYTKRYNTGNVHYQVRIGPFSNDQDAETMLHKIKTEGYRDAFIIKVNE
ncbi:SPOR domain-containing protein [bacterium]|nr:SPOR domain-containing protein [candidate division CSSED10-310 bacterium]